MTQYQDNSLGWQIQRAWQNGSEWTELQVNRLFSNLLDVDIDPPQIEDLEWWERLIFHSLLGLLVGLFVLWIWWNRATWQRLWRYLLQPKAALVSLTPTATVSIAAWQQQAQTAAQQGDYNAACRCLYFATLQYLTENQLIAASPGMTDQEYWRRTQALPDKTAYSLLLLTHQRLFFWRETLSCASFEACQQALKQLAYR